MPIDVSKRLVSEREELLDELLDTQRRLTEANNRFNLVTQPELIEQCVYEINALKARHAYYIRVLREGDAE